MENEALKNSERFSGFADIYDAARPSMPLFPVEVIARYLGYRPETVVDLGCGSGLSTVVWEGRCGKAIGIEPNDDMLKAAENKRTDGITFKKGYSHETGLQNTSADAVVCSQSFHWMEPVSTLNEVSRLLREGGVFAAVDCDWPPVLVWRAEKAYIELSERIEQIERSNEALCERFIKFEKEKHLENIIKSGHFRFAREIVFSNREKCTPRRFIGLALSQGSLQSILKLMPEAIKPYIDSFTEEVNNALGEAETQADFCYRMRIAVK